MHPIIVIQAYRQALEDAAIILKCTVAIKIELKDASTGRKVIQSRVDTRVVAKWRDITGDIAMDAVKTVPRTCGEKKETDINRYAKIGEIPDGRSKDSTLRKGIMFNKDVTYPTIKRRSKKPRISPLDGHLEYKKGGSQTNIKILKEDNVSKIIEQKEVYTKKIGDEITAFKPDLTITEKGVSDLAQHFPNKVGVTAVRRLRKSDNRSVARPGGATIVNRTEKYVTFS